MVLAQSFSVRLHSDVSWDTVIEGWRVALSHGWQFGAGCWWEASVLPHMGLFTGLLESLHGVVAGFPQSKQTRSPRGILQSFLDLTWEFT